MPSAVVTPSVTPSAKAAQDLTERDKRMPAEIGAIYP